MCSGHLLNSKWPIDQLLGRPHFTGQSQRCYQMHVGTRTYNKKTLRWHQDWAPRHPNVSQQIFDVDLSNLIYGYIWARTRHLVFHWKTNCGLLKVKFDLSLKNSIKKSIVWVGVLHAIQQTGSYCNRSSALSLVGLYRGNSLWLHA